MSAAPVEEFEVGDLDPASLLELAAANEAEIRQRELLRLRFAYQWAVLHPATTDTGVATPGGPALDVLTADESLGGDGTPAVAAFAPEAFAARLGMSPAAGAQLIGDAQDLVHRHPILWKRVQALEVPAWQARRVAQQTHRLPLASALWVDQQLAAHATGSVGPVVTDRLVAEAAARFDPEIHEDREQEAQASWDVELTHPDPTEFTGTSQLTATGDTPTLGCFHDLVCTVAHQLLLSGDTSPLGVRKIKAIRLITTLATQVLAGDRALDLAGLAPEDLDKLGQTVAKLGGKIKLIVRVDAADLEVDATGGTTFAVATVEKLGAATMAKLREWVGHHQVVFLPVLNMQRRDAVDSHDPPPWMQELVELRDGHCVFPRCTVDARDCDKDHMVPYLPLDEGGPPGQTSPEALACLCRRHHRAKTAGVWRYARTPEGHYLWHGPYGTRYLVTPTGTTRL